MNVQARWETKSGDACMTNTHTMLSFFITFGGCRVAASSCSASHFRKSFRGVLACCRSAVSHAAGDGTARSRALAVALLRRLFFLVKKSSRASFTTCSKHANAQAGSSTHYLWETLCESQKEKSAAKQHKKHTHEQPTTQTELPPACKTPKRPTCCACALGM